MTEEKNLIRLNLGCGSRILPDYTNIDLHNRRAQVNHDLRKPLPYNDESVDEILAEHIIEHFTPAEWISVKQDWVRVLKVGGKLIIHCPDIMRCAQHLLYERKKKRRWLLPIYGNPKQTCHKNGFTLEFLQEDLIPLGIEIVNHFYLNDRRVNPGGFNICIEFIKRRI